MKTLLKLLPFLICCTHVFSASSLSFFGGWHDSDVVTAESGSVEIENFSILGLRFERTYFQVLGFESSLGYSRDALVLEDAAESESALYLSGTLLLNLPISGILVPNVAFGLGTFHRIGDSFPDFGTSFQTNWGAGVKLRGLLGPLGARFDYRRFKIFDVEEDSLSTQEFSVGVLLSF